MNSVNEKLLIAVCSKNRASTMKTYKLLEQDKLSYCLFVEPQEAEEYFQTVDQSLCQVVTIPENDKGLAYVRNKMVEYARAKNYEWVLVLDDDINQFGRYFASKNVKETAKYVLEKAFKKLQRFPEVTVASLEYRQYAWTSKEYNFDTFCDVCTFINVQKNKCVFDENLKIKVDRDFNIQTMQAGHRTMRFGDLYFSCPTIGTNEGGLNPVYSNDELYNSTLDYMVKKWGRNICKIIVKKNNFKDLKINWKNIPVKQ